MLKPCTGDGACGGSGGRPCPAALPSVSNTATAAVSILCLCMRPGGACSGFLLALTGRYIPGVVMKLITEKSVEGRASSFLRLSVASETGYPQDQSPAVPEVSEVRRRLR